MPPINIKIINQGEDHSNGNVGENETVSPDSNPKVEYNAPQFQSNANDIPNNIDPPAEEVDFNNLIIKRI
tara:strand:- start:415 stop:624 length:210 start_codon:yes stop_codon:yes gene_type:complete